MYRWCGDPPAKNAHRESIRGNLYLFMQQRGIKWYRGKKSESDRADFPAWDSLDYWGTSGCWSNGRWRERLALSLQLVKEQYNTSAAINAPIHPWSLSFLQHQVPDQNPYSHPIIFRSHTERPYCEIMPIIGTIYMFHIYIRDISIKMLGAINLIIHKI